jgi:hypothetical protein
MDDYKWEATLALRVVEKEDDQDEILYNKYVRFDLASCLGREDGILGRPGSVFIPTLAHCGVA